MSIKSTEITPVVTQSGVQADVYMDNLRAAWALPYLNAGHNEITDLLPAQRDCLGGQDEFEAIQHVARIAVAALTTPATPLEQRLYELAESADEYDKLFIAIQELEDRLSQLQSELNSAGTAYPTLQTFAKQVLGVVPIAEKPITNIIQSATDKRYTSLLDEKASVTLQLQELYTLRDTASKPWPVPQAMYRFPVLNQILVIDNLPVDPKETVGNNGEVCCSRINRAEIMQKASKLLAELLLANIDTSFLPEDLGRVLYANTDLSDLGPLDREEYYRKNIHNLLKPSAEIVERFLKDAGYTLQRGWRRYLNPSNGKLMRRHRRIYRVVHSDDADKQVYLYETCDDSELPIIIPRRKTKPPLEALPRIEVDEMATSIEYQQLKEDVKKAIETLSEFKLLPPLSKDGLFISHQRLRTAILGKCTIKGKIKNQYIRSLNNYIETSTQRREHYDVLDVVIGCLHAQWLTSKKSRTDKEYYTRIDIINGALEEHYESMVENIQD